MCAYKITVTMVNKELFEIRIIFPKSLTESHTTQIYEREQPSMS